MGWDASSPLPKPIEKGASRTSPYTFASLTHPTPIKPNQSTLHH